MGKVARGEKRETWGTYGGGGGGGVSEKGRVAGYIEAREIVDGYSESESEFDLILFGDFEWEWGVDFLGGWDGGKDDVV